jgi:peptide/nickel transport system ATP-binding protein
VSAPEIILELRQLRQYFPVPGGRGRVVRAVDGVSLRLKAGEILAVVGESGSGKSSIARTVALLYRPAGGEILFQGRSVGALRGRELKEYRRHVQMVFQDPFASLNPTLTVEAHILRPLRLHHPGQTWRQLREQALELLTAVGLTPPEAFLRRYPHELSGGQRQRVGFARALAPGPQLVLADEPVSMLDVSLRIGVLNLMRETNQRRGVSYLYITHDLASARYLARRTVVLYAGEVVEEGPTEEVIDRPAHPYTQLLVRAAPDPERHLAPVPLTAGGEPPDLTRPPSGCRFHPRCPLAMPRCSQVSPTFSSVGPDHTARCHLLAGEAS